MNLTAERYKIDDNFCRKLKPPASGYVIYKDRQMREFAVRVTDGGTIAFILNYSTNGSTRRYTIGAYPGWSVAAAREEAQKIISSGRDPLEERQAQRDELTLGELADEYLAVAEKKLRPGSLRNVRGILANIVRPKLGKLRVSAVSRRHVEQLHGSLRSTPFHANRVLALLSKMFNYAIGCKLVGSNPVKGIERYHEEPRQTWLSLEQLQALEAALADYPDQIVADAIRLLIVTGSREMEVLSASWSQFDLKRELWTKPAHSTKQNRTEQVPLNRAALSIIARLKQNASGAYLFPGADGESHRVTIRKPWLQVLRTAGLAQGTIVPSKRGAGFTKTIWKPLVRVHDLRHTFASHLVSAGASLPLVGKLLGHTQASTTQRYAHCSQQALRDVTNSFPLLTTGVQ